MWLDVNGKRMQTGNTRTMIFDVAKLVSYVSHFMTLGIQGLGEQRQLVVPFKA
jgi:2-keto-4-pentenoate hydratase/2-oxohepta-3-ene-1,7-dioic acid hydratase in catechol pathway